MRMAEAGDQETGHETDAKLERIQSGTGGGFSLRYSINVAARDGILEIDNNFLVCMFEELRYVYSLTPRCFVDGMRFDIRRLFP